MPKLLIFDEFTLLIPKKTVANYALLRCKTFSLKIWVCKIFDKFHVCILLLHQKSLFMNLVEPHRLDQNLASIHPNSLKVENIYR